MQVDVLDPVSGVQVFSCAGPDQNGGCVRAPAADTLPCEGHVLRTRSGNGLLDGFRFTVDRSGPACPLRCFLLDLA